MKFNTLPILLVTTFLSTSAMAITLEPTLDDSVISYSEGTSTDYNFTTQEADANGNLTTKYYKIDINKDKLSTSSNISWSEVDEAKKDESNVVAVKLPNNQTKYFQYSYSAPNGYSTISERINNTLADADVTDVVFKNITSTSYGGAIYNTKDNADIDIKADFIGNYVSSSSTVSGGAIYNGDGASSIGNITGDFIGNYATSSGSYVYGGAIFNGSGGGASIGNITGDFIGNYASTTGSSSTAYGGAIYNRYDATISDITGDFIGNYVSSPYIVYGGAIYNSDTIGDITGDFIGNYATSSGGSAYGGAICNFFSIIIGDITGDFIGNYVSSSYAHGGAIYNDIGTIGDITGDFIGNYAANSSQQYGFGGAICNEGEGVLGDIKGDFIGNYAASQQYADGGAIHNFYSTIGDITGDFIGNYAASQQYADGGAIHNEGVLGDIKGDFIGNYATALNDSAKGGAIYTNKNMTFTSDSETYFFDGNYTSDSRGKIYNAIYGTSATMTFDTSGGGAWVINDNIENGNYNFIGDDTIDTELGTTTQYINMNNAIVNAGEVTVENTTLRFGNYQHEDKTAKNWDGKGKFIASLNSDGTENLEADSVTSLTLNNAVFDISNGYLETVKLKKYSATDSFVHLDVDVENMKSDVINVKGDVDGVTKLVIHATSDKDIRGKGQILFAESFGDTKGGETSFEVARVYKSPYLYDVIYEGVENTSTPTVSKDNTWYFEMNRNDNPNEEDAPVDPNPDVPSVDDYIPDDNINAVSAPEVIAGIGLHTAGIEQTRSVVRNVSGKVANAHSYCPNCGIMSDAWDGEQLRNAWVLARGENANIDKPVDMEAKIWGVEGGFDLQSDMNNIFGVFASYRNGEYDLSGKGSRYRSNIGSEIEIDSYLAGLYYRYDKNMNWLFATVYGGTQEAEANTDDGIASFETDGIEFGASAEIGHSFVLNNTTTLSPSLGIYYTQINYDAADDNVGKEYKWDDIKHLEAELALSLAKNFENGKVYVKPSVIQTLTADDEVSITGLNEIDTYHDQTLGRIEIGGNYGFNDNWSAYGWANYTFGSDYEATSLGAGLNYAW